MSETNRYQRYTVGEISTNAYILNGEYVIDPGGISRELAKSLVDFQDRLKGILLTHAHYDHIAGISEVKETVDIPIYCHPDEVEMLCNPEKNMSQWAGQTVSFDADHTISEGSELELMDGTIRTLHTPGHTRGSLSFHLDEDNLLFAGDTLFREGIGRTDLPGGDHQKLLRSIQEKILTLPRKTTVLPGHGPKTTVGSEADNNSFLTNPT